MYPPSNKSTVWCYDLIQRAVNQFDWVRALPNVNVDQLIRIFIPHETIICGKRDPPWINKEIKKPIVENNLTYKSSYANRDIE